MPHDGEDAEETGSKDFISSTYFMDYRFITYIRPATNFGTYYVPAVKQSRSAERKFYSFYPAARRH